MDGLLPNIVALPFLITLFVTSKRQIKPQGGKKCVWGGGLQGEDAAAKIARESSVRAGFFLNHGGQDMVDPSLFCVVVSCEMVSHIISANK